MRKLFDTIRICACLFMARTFGEYLHSGWDGAVEYHRYAWRGKEWSIPKGPAEPGLWL
jgi:hypothetical protein